MDREWRRKRGMEGGREGRDRGVIHPSCLSHFQFWCVNATGRPGQDGREYVMAAEGRSLILPPISPTRPCPPPITLLSPSSSSLSPPNMLSSFPSLTPLFLSFLNTQFLFLYFLCLQFSFLVFSDFLSFFFPVMRCPFVIIFIFSFSP